MSSLVMNDETRTFQLLQPAKLAGLSAEELGRLQAAQSDVAGKHAAILVVDDSEPLRSVMVLTLHRLGYDNVSEAPDGLAALDLLRRREFDLLVLDIEMPKLDGFGVLAALASDPERRHLPVIVTSGLDQLDAVVRCIELGAEDFLSKPVNSVLLRARIGSSLERKRLRDLERLRVIELKQEKQLLEIEQEKSERLLLNILPKAIAARLKQSDRTIAERYSEVSVLFADLVDFTALTNRTDPEELVSLLNDLFSRFDHIADEHGLEKIKTIGDSYFVVGGLPERRPDHADAVAAMAVEMLAALEDLNRARGLNLCLRIGVNSGPVVAGVIGRKKFTYDLWGATVNFASRLQSAGVAGRINVSDATYELLKDKFDFTERGTVITKGSGEVRTYLLESRKSAVA
jgi:class 3 adenylate cyclase/CheY-like chemotaxis protein